MLIEIVSYLSRSFPLCPSLPRQVFLLPVVPIFATSDKKSKMKRESGTKEKLVDERMGSRWPTSKMDPCFFVLWVTNDNLKGNKRITQTHAYCIRVARVFLFFWSSVKHLSHGSNKGQTARDTCEASMLIGLSTVGRFAHARFVRFHPIMNKHPKV